MMVDVTYIIFFCVITYFFILTVCYIVKKIRVQFRKCYPVNFVTQYGEWAVVTGCTDGIGLAFSKELARRGLNLVLISRNQEKLDKVSREIVEFHKVQTKIIQVDFTGDESIYRKIAEGINGLDIGILVNNVGVIVDHPMFIEEMSEQQISDHIKCNVTSVSFMTSLILPDMKKKKRGAIINLSSLVALAPTPLMSIYSACKAYVQFLSQCLMFECRNSGVTIQCLTPGYVNTRMVGYSESLTSGSQKVVPSAELYVSNAIHTLGIFSNTSGYYMHESQEFFAGWTPKIWTYISGLVNTKFREAFIKNKERIKSTE